MPAAGLCSKCKRRLFSAVVFRLSHIYISYVSTSIFDISGLKATIFTCAIGHCGRPPVCASSTVCLTNRVFSQNTLFLNLLSSRGTQQTWIMWLSWTGFLTGLKHWFQMCNVAVSHAETQTLIHSHMYSQYNPVKKAALLSLSSQNFMHFSSIHFQTAWRLMKAWLRLTGWPHPGWSICPAAIILICHLLTE